jgi:hypothetical protein
MLVRPGALQPHPAIMCPKHLMFDGQARRAMVVGGLGKGPCGYRSRCESCLTTAAMPS